MDLSEFIARSRHLGQFAEDDGQYFCKLSPITLQRIIVKSVLILQNVNDSMARTRSALRLGSNGYAKVAFSHLLF